MNCTEYRALSLEAAPNERGYLDGHATGCPHCALWLEELAALTAAERHLRAEAALVPVPLQIEANLAAVFDRAHRKRKLLPPWWWVPAAAAGMAAVAVMWLSLPRRVVPLPASIPLAMVRPAPQPPAEPAQARAVTPTVKVARAVKKHRHVKSPVLAARAPEPEQPFIQIPYTLPLAPYERAAVLRMEMPVSALIAAGVPVETANAGARAQADVIVGDDGRARAFRVISISAVDSDRSSYR